MCKKLIVVTYFNSNNTANKEETLIRRRKTDKLIGVRLVIMKKHIEMNKHSLSGCYIQSVLKYVANPL